MSYNHFRYARKIDADTIGIYKNDLTQLMTMNDGTANTIKYSGGSATTGDELWLSANTTDTYPYIRLDGDNTISFYHSDTKFAKINNATGEQFRFHEGEIYFRERTASNGNLANFGQLYTKADNNLYFIDGAGASHTIAFA